MMFMIMRIVVVLPAPLGPSRPKMVPRGTWSERSFTAGKRPKDFETFVSSIAFSMRARRLLRISWTRVWRKTGGRTAAEPPEEQTGALLEVQAESLRQKHGHLTPRNGIVRWV